jgi:hypothetical protein
VAADPSKPWSGLDAVTHPAALLAEVEAAEGCCAGASLARETDERLAIR